MTPFEIEMQKLNSAQREAVEAIEGPVMVVAGPGTGKTQVLTLRIANILARTDTPPDAILALTFTDAAALNMRRRLVALVGSLAYRVGILTFHGFCNGIIMQRPEMFPRIAASQQLPEGDQIRIVEALIAESDVEALKPFGDPLYYTRPVVKAISNLKREGVDPAAFDRISKEECEAFEAFPDLRYESGRYMGRVRGKYQEFDKRNSKNTDLAKLYRAYETRLAEAGLYDYDDMIMETLKALERNPDLLLSLQEQYQYILVDEHQDTNNAQNRIVEFLASFHEHPNVFVVGDEKQAIFRFQGASMENFLYFKKRFPDARLITLEENYRSAQQILDGAENILPGHTSLKASATAHTHRSRLPAIRLYAFLRADAEAGFVANDIATLLKEGIPADEIAVLYRDNRDALSFTWALEKANIPFVILSKEDVLGDPNIKKLLTLLRAAGKFGEEDVFIEALHIDFLGIEPIDIYKLISRAHKDRVSVYDTAFRILKDADTKLIVPERLIAFLENLSRWASAGHNRSLSEFFETVVYESGFLAYLMKSPRPAVELEKLNMLFDEVKSFAGAHRDAKLADLLSYLQTLKDHRLFEKKSFGNSRTGKVQLTTAHGAKGLEFAHVYLTGAFDGHWGGRRIVNTLQLPDRVYTTQYSSVDTTRATDDERRLFYVALTRAKKRVTITYAREDANGKERLPCQFIGELGEGNLAVMDAAPHEARFAAERAMLFAPHQKNAPQSMEDKGFIKTAFDERGLHVTALNNYLACPWKYFYMNLFRIPKAETKHQLYGQAVHAALHDFFEQAKTEGLPPAKHLTDRFAFYLRKKPLAENDYASLLKKGARALSGYYDAYHKTWPLRTLTEFAIKGVLLDDICLTGKMDKMEFLGGGSEVNVVDYKTSKPKSRGVIAGTTASSRGDLGRQLVFYKLLLDRYDNGRYRMVSGDIDFIEPDERGRYHREPFRVAPGEVQELEKLIRIVAAEIRDLAFLERRCGDAECEFCALREIMK